MSNKTKLRGRVARTVDQLAREKRRRSVSSIVERDETRATRQTEPTFDGSSRHLLILFVSLGSSHTEARELGHPVVKEECERISSRVKKKGAIDKRRKNERDWSSFLDFVLSPRRDKPQTAVEAVSRKVPVPRGNQRYSSQLVKKGRGGREKGLSSLPSLLLVGFRLELIHLFESLEHQNKSTGSVLARRRTRRDRG